MGVDDQFIAYSAVGILGPDSRSNSSRQGNGFAHGHNAWDECQCAVQRGAKHRPNRVDIETTN